MILKSLGMLAVLTATTTPRSSTSGCAARWWRGTSCGWKSSATSPHVQERRTYIGIKRDHVLWRHDLATEGAEFPDDVGFLEDVDDDDFGIGEGDMFYKSDGDFDFFSCT